MFLKDYLKEIYQKASFDKNQLIVENTINRWAHRFGIDSLNELIVKNQEEVSLIAEDPLEENQEQISLIAEDPAEENQEQISLIAEDPAEEINLEKIESFQSQKEIDFKTTETKTFNNTEIKTKGIYESHKNKSDHLNRGKLPLPNIKNLRKWIHNDKKAS